MSTYSRHHRRMGIAVAGFLVLFIISGLLIQHTSWLGLDKRHIPAGAARFLYGVVVSKITTYKTMRQRVSHAARALYINDIHVAHVELNELRGAVENSNGIWVAGDGGLWLLSTNGELLDRFSTADGLPEQVVRLGQADDELVIDGLYQQWRLKEDQSGWDIYHGRQVAWSQAEAQRVLSQKERTALLSDAQGRLITWERLLLDLHSGRLFGTAGVVVVDAAALILMLLAVTGVVLWTRRR